MINTILISLHEEVDNYKVTSFKESKEKVAAVRHEPSLGWPRL